MANSAGKNLLQLPLKTLSKANSSAPIIEENEEDSGGSSNSGDINNKNQPLSSKVMFSEESVAIGTEDGDDPNEQILQIEDSDRESWDNKTQFFLGVISYAVGFGNIWRFPALLQKNGGGAFLIPYILMMVFQGIPLFLIELGIGQRLQTGPVGVWNAIHPYLGGIGVSSAIVSYFVGLYYNVILTWVLYYLFMSFRPTLPWSACPKLENGTTVHECAISTSPTNYFWNREAIATSNSINDTQGFTMHITICLVFAWILIYLCVMKGIQSSGKVMYLTATFPYMVTTIFLCRSLMLEGATDGLLYMLNPDLSRLYDPEVWLEAATQIFYSMGLGFGGLIAFASYNPLKNNCKKDCLWLSAANLLTSLYTALVIFSVLGYMGHKNYMNCIDSDMQLILKHYPGRYADLADIKNNISVQEFAYWTEHNFKHSEFPLLSQFSKMCNYHTIIEQAAEGTGLAFVVFTEAIIQFPMPPLWAILFFLMLLMLGLGSMFGTLEGVITSLNDSNMVRVKKPVMTAILCASACLIGLIFTTGSGQYWVSLFDHFAGTYALMCVAFFEIIAVIYVYGFRRFVRDLEFMTGEKIGKYWTITWRFISPTIMFVLFTCSVIKSFQNIPQYLAYNSETATQHKVNYPTWALFIAFLLVVLAMAPVPFIWFVRKFKIWKIEADIPVANTFTNLRQFRVQGTKVEASKCLGSTPSTTYMLKSEISFNRMVESTASELQSVGVNNKLSTTKAMPNGTTSSDDGGQTSTTSKPRSSNKPAVKYEPVARHHRIRTHVFSSAGAPNAREKNINENLTDAQSHKDHQSTWHGGVFDRKTQQILSKNRRKSFSEN